MMIKPVEFQAVCDLCRFVYSFRHFNLQAMRFGSRVISFVVVVLVGCFTWSVDAKIDATEKDKEIWLRSHGPQTKPTK